MVFGSDRAEMLAWKSALEVCHLSAFSHIEPRLVLSRARVYSIERWHFPVGTRSVTILPSVSGQSVKVTASRRYAFLILLTFC